MDNKAYLDMINSEEYLKLYEYYNQKTFMDVLGVSRHENEHSNFLAWLFNPDENHGMGDYPLRKLLQTVAFKRKKDEKYTPAATENLLNEVNAKYIDDFIYDNFRIESVENISREKVIPNQKRLDIFVKLQIAFQSINETQTINLLIENKIKSSENDKQTNGYAKWLFEQDGFSIPVYLVVATNEELKNFYTSKQKPANSEFMVLNYQYLMDGVLEPCTFKNKTDFGERLLEDYKKCLGKALKDETQSNKENKTFVMATSKLEKDLVQQLWNNHSKVLIEEFEKYNKDYYLSINDIGPFYNTISETLLALIESQKIDVDEENKKIIQSTLNGSSVKKTYIYDYEDQNCNKISQKYKKGQKSNGYKTIGMFGHQLINDYSKNVSFKELNEKLDDTKIAKGNHWLHGIVFEKSKVDDNKLTSCNGYHRDKNKRTGCGNCTRVKIQDICCKEDFEHWFFADDDMKITSGDSIEFYVARYFTEENVETLYKKFGFSVKIERE